MSCLAKDPEQRPESAARLAELLLACECGSWSHRDARYWWEEFGEAARSESAVDESEGAVVRSNFEVEVEDSRG